MVLEAIVIPSDQPACMAVSSILYAKLKRYDWHTLESHQDAQSSYVYIKMIHSDLVRFHGKMYEWGEARVAFCNVYTIMPFIPEPTNFYKVARLS